VTDRSIERLAERAETLAGAWGARARASTTLGQERAILRLFGGDGTRPIGPAAGRRRRRPLANERHDGLGGGIALPFTMAMSEYDLDPQQLRSTSRRARSTCALEAELLREPDRRAMAGADARRMVGAAVERIDADRVARRELVDLLGEARGRGSARRSPSRRRRGARRGAAPGIGRLRPAAVEVPIGRELADRMHIGRCDAPEWRPASGRRSRAPEDIDEGRPAPSGSQRAWRVCAGRRRRRRPARGYVRLGPRSRHWASRKAPSSRPSSGSTWSRPTRWPRSSSGASTRIARSPTTRSPAASTACRHVHLDRPGPLVVAPGPRVRRAVGSGDPLGRALALQLLGCALARADRDRAERIVVGRLPGWLADEPSALADPGRGRCPAIAVPDHDPVRRALDAASETAAALAYVVSNALARTARRPPHADRRPRWPSRADARAAAANCRGAALGLASVARCTASPGPRDAMLGAALTTLERLSDLGWRAVVGDPPRSAAASATLRLGDRR
jgi:hypothetical protein